MDPFTIALATFGVQKLRGKSTKRALRDAALLGGGAYAFGAAAGAGSIPGVTAGQGFLGNIGQGSAFSGLKGILGQKAMTQEAAKTALGEGATKTQIAEAMKGSGILGMDTGTKLVTASTLLPLLAGGDEDDGKIKGYDPDKADEVFDRLDDVKEKVIGPKRLYHDSMEEKNKAHKEFNTNNFSEKNFNISDLKPLQGSVDVSSKERTENKFNSPSTVRVATHEGEHYILDGHHTVAAAIANRNKKIKVMHINLDDY